MIKPTIISKKSFKPNVVSAIRDVEPPLPPVVGKIRLATEELSQASRVVVFAAT